MTKAGSRPRDTGAATATVPDLSGTCEEASRAAALDPVDPTLFALVIEALETDRFFEVLRDFINAAVQIDNCVALAFSADTPPLILHQWSPQEPNYFQMLYCQGAYVLDPFYRVSLDDRRGGTFLLDEIAPDSFDESDFYQTYYRKVQMIDEIGLLCPIDERRTIHLSLGRRSKSEHYSPADVARIRYLEPVLRALLMRHARVHIDQWRKTSLQARAPGAPGAQIASRWLAPYNVTSREAEIAAMVLRGHSNTSIGLTLNISMETVKVHRRNLYGKVRISSQAELYMLFINHILEGSEDATSGVH